MVHPSFKLKDPSLLASNSFVNGKAAKTKSKRAPFPVIDPANGDVWAEAQSMDDEDTDDAIAVAHAMFPSWSATPSRQRAKMILKLDGLLRESKEDFAQLIVMETGKSLVEARGEVDYAASYSWLMMGECERNQGEYIQHGDNPNQRYLVSRKPVGPVALMAPWNFPVAIPFRKIVSALAAGCTSVVKPSPETPITSVALGILCQRAGIPDGVVNIVTASTETTPLVGKKLCEDPRIKKISFTGSTPVGKLLMGYCANTLKKLTLELGGNGGWLVFEDADLDAAAEATIANKLRNAGQVCVCANRVFVQRTVIDKFSKILNEKVSKLKFGHGLDEGITHGCMTTERGVERAVKLVEDAVQNGATLVTGGKRFGNGYHFQPTILTGASLESQVYITEMFSPIISIYPFDTEEEVVAACNSSPMGLNNYLWTKDLSRALRCADNLESGTVGINSANPNSAAAPFGGIKESGLGKEGGFKYGIEEFCYAKNVAITI